MHKYLKIDSLRLRARSFLFIHLGLLGCLVVLQVWGSQAQGLAQQVNQIALPEGYVRSEVSADSYAAYLQRLALKEDTLIYLHDGTLKPDQSFGWAVINVDVGPKNLQQCADAAIRLRAEYLFEQKRFEEIHFNFSSGHTAKYTEWREGYRAEVIGKQVRWVKKAGYDESYANFKAYLEVVFNYAGSWSLEKELKPISSPEKLEIGDMLVKGAFPGHVMIVIDKAHHPETNESIYLLAQSARPAQDIHIVKNRLDPMLSPWYHIQAFKTKLEIEEWTFYPENLKRF